MNKEDLFLSEIEGLIHVYGGTHWDWYKLPIPMRKWYIQRWNKRQEKQSNKPSTDRPLTDIERKKMLTQAQKVQNPVSVRDFMTPQRNVK